MPPTAATKRSPPSTKGKAKQAISKDGSRGTISAAFQRAKEHLEAEAQRHAPSAASDASVEPEQVVAIEESAVVAAPTTAAEASSSTPAPPPLTAEEDQELRAFDLNYKFGPCIGPLRLERWERARRLGLDPPARVKEILAARENTDANQCMLAKYQL